jgi:uncharacterized coiled-coil protein SlyX
MNIEKHIVDLEKKIAFQDAAIEELTAVTTEQFKRIEALERELKLFKDKVESGDLVRKREDEERPPHY